MFFTRWGRVGVPGQMASIPQGNPDSAKYLYNKKYREKLNGGYREVQMNYEDDKTEEK
jgi:predicted DNA-binding WGR domain protein